MHRFLSDCTLLLLSGKDSRTDYANSVTMKMTYIPPYGEFDLLKKLQLKLRRTSEKFSPETLVIDLSEWIEHPYDEFFEVMAKYFHDHRDVRYVFTAHADRTEAAPMFTVLRTFLPLHIEEDKTFSELSSLNDYIKANYRISPHAAGYLAELVMRPEGGPLRSYTALDSLLEELTNENTQTVGFRTLVYSLHDSDTLLGTLFANSNENKGGNIYEYEKAI